MNTLEPPHPLFDIFVYRMKSNFNRDKLMGQLNTPPAGEWSYVTHRLCDIQMQLFCEIKAFKVTTTDFDLSKSLKV